jgi:mRNA interferase MazF
MIKRGDIYYVNFGQYQGSKQGGVRPAIIMSNNLNNRYSPTLTVVPLTSNLKKRDLPTHVFVGKECGLNRDSLALAEQVTNIDKSCLLEYITECPEIIMRQLSIAYGIQGGLFELHNNQLVNVM